MNILTEIGTRVGQEFKDQGLRIGALETKSPVITLTGDITGTGTLSNLGDVTITTVIDPAYRPNASSGNTELKGPNTAVEATQITILIDGWLAGRTYTVSVSGGTWTRNADTIFWSLPTVLTDTIHSITVTDVGYGSYVHEVNVLYVSSIADDSIINTVFIGDYPANGVEFSSPTYEQEVGDTDWKDYQAELYLEAKNLTIINNDTIEIPFSYSGTEVLVKRNGVITKKPLGTKVNSKITNIIENNVNVLSLNISNNPAIRPLSFFSDDGVNLYIVNDNGPLEMLVVTCDPIFKAPALNKNYSTSKVTSVSSSRQWYSVTPLANGDGILAGSTNGYIQYVPFNTNRGVSFSNTGLTNYTLTELSTETIYTIAMSSDGKKFWAASASETLHQYSLLTPYDLSSRVYDGYKIMPGVFIHGSVSRTGYNLYGNSSTSARNHIFSYSTSIPNDFINGVITYYNATVNPSSDSNTRYIVDPNEAALLVYTSGSSRYIRSLIAQNGYSSSYTGRHSSITGKRVSLGTPTPHPIGFWVHPEHNNIFIYSISSYLYYEVGGSIIYSTTLSDSPTGNISSVHIYGNGKKLFIQKESGNGAVYTLTTPYDPRSSVLDYTFTGPGKFIVFYISEDGMTVFTYNTRDSIHKYSLTSPYAFNDTWTATQQVTVISVINSYSGNYCFSDDGRLLVGNGLGTSGSSSIRILTYALSIPFDLNSAVFISNILTPFGDDYGTGVCYSKYYNGFVSTSNITAERRLMTLNTYTNGVPVKLNTSPGDSVYLLPAEKLSVAIDDVTVTANQATDVPFVGYEEVNGDIICKTDKITVPGTARFVAYKTKHGSNASVLKAVKLNLWKV